MSRTSSRLIRKEEKKLKKQTYWYVSLAVGIGLLFIFVILPQSVRVFQSVFGEPIVIDDSDTIPPQIPILSLPYAATSSATIALGGFAEAKSEVVVLVDATEEKRFTVEESGKFDLSLDLEEGDHAVTAYSIDPSGNESKVSSAYDIRIDTSVPTLELYNITDGQTFETRKNQQIQIEGKTEPGAKVYLNERLVLPSSEGMFRTTYYLQEGENELTFQAKDEAGNTMEQNVTVKFEL